MRVHESPSSARPLQVRMAPEPEDIIWENLQYSTVQRRTRLALSTFILVFLTIVTATIEPSSSP